MVFHSPLPSCFDTTISRDVQELKKEPEFSEMQYVSFADALTGREIRRVSESRARNGAVLVSVAAKIGKTRLIDNLVLLGEANDIGEAA